MLRSDIIAQQDGEFAASLEEDARRDAQRAFREMLQQRAADTLASCDSSSTTSSPQRLSPRSLRRKRLDFFEPAAPCAVSRPPDTCAGITKQGRRCRRLVKAGTHCAAHR